VSGGELVIARPVDALALCRESIAQNSKSFALASKLLPPASRDDAIVLYAWCRRADDAVDGAPPVAAADALARLRRELDDVYAGRVDARVEPTLAALADVVRRRAIPRLYPEELLAGMEMDVRGTLYGSTEQLLGYAYRVAGVVGLMMCHVMGLSDARARRQAVHLGIAMQLTNIARDVDADWQLGRLYLPDELLQPAGLGWLRERVASGPLPETARDGLRGVVRGLLAIAERFYRSGDGGLPALPFRAAVSIRTARAVYAAIGDELAQKGHDVLGGRAVVSTGRKLWLALRSVGAEVVRAPRRWIHGFRPVQLPGQLRFPDDVLPL
jgi:phytoene synthase